MITRKQIINWKKERRCNPLSDIHNDNGYTFEELRRHYGYIEDVDETNGEVTTVYNITEECLRGILDTAIDAEEIGAIVVGDVDYYYRLHVDYPDILATK